MMASISELAHFMTIEDVPPPKKNDKSTNTENAMPNVLSISKEERTFRICNVIECYFYDLAKQNNGMTKKMTKVHNATQTDRDIEEALMEDTITKSSINQENIKQTIQGNMNSDQICKKISINLLIGTSRNHFHTTSNGLPPFLQENLKAEE